MDNSDSFYDPNQIPLFSRETMILAEGYRSLASFSFKEARRYFNVVLEAEPESGNREEARRALTLCTDWQRIVSQNHNGELLPFEEIDILRIYKQFRIYEFENTPGERQFQQALLRAIKEQMLEAGLFYTGQPDETVADLMTELGLYKKAETVVLEQMKRRPGDHRLFYCLAQTQWQIRRKGEAKKNYALGLLHDPCGLPLNRIVYTDLKKLIQTEGPEMAPAFGWVRGILPLVPLQDEVPFCGPAHRRAVNCYRLLWQADKAVRNRNIDASVEYRKKLKAEAPGLYEEYFTLLGN